MNRILSQSELCEDLEHVKQFLNGVDFNTISNVVFYNPESFFCYINAMPLEHYVFQNIEELLEELQPYIPLVLSEQNLEYFVTASMILSDEEIENMKHHFKAHMNVDFINFVHNISDKEAWRELLQTCESIRACKAEYARLV